MVGKKILLKLLTPQAKMKIATSPSEGGFSKESILLIEYIVQRIFVYIIYYQNFWRYRAIVLVSRFARDPIMVCPTYSQKLVPLLLMLVPLFAIVSPALSHC